MISLAPRRLSFRRAASMTMRRKSPSYGSKSPAALRSTVWPVKSRAIWSEPIQSPAALTASSQLRVSWYGVSSLKVAGNHYHEELPTSHPFLGRKSPEASGESGHLFAKLTPGSARWTSAQLPTNQHAQVVDLSPLNAA